MAGGLTMGYQRMLALVVVNLVASTFAYILWDEGMARWLVVPVLLAVVINVLLVRTAGVPAQSSQGHVLTLKWLAYFSLASAVLSIPSVLHEFHSLGLV